jgi:hypothetical protein
MAPTAIESAWPEAPNRARIVFRFVSLATPYTRSGERARPDLDNGRHATDNRPVSDPGDETTEPLPGPAPSDAPPYEPAAAPDPSTQMSPATHPLNMLAVVSPVLGAAYFIVGISFGLAGKTAPLALLVLPVGAVITGYVARGQIWRNRERGRLVASVGVALGYLGLALLLFGLALTLLFR